MISEMLDSRELTISLVEYKRLLGESIILRKIKENIYDGCSLSWDKKELRFDDNNLNGLLRILDYGNYKETLIELQEKAEKEEKSKNVSDV